MKKTINISIGGYSFFAEEDAFQKLDGYLESVKNHFATYPESAEIVADIEARMAEQFAAKTANKIITLELVEELVKNMGSPEQMSGESKNGEGDFKNEQGSQKGGKKMLRNPDDVIIAGVASGIAAYFNIDAVWIRLGFVLLTLGSGFGILLYIVLWIILPEAKTDTEKMQMRGETVNLKNVEAVVKERVEEFKKKDRSKLKSLLASPFYALGAVIRGIGLFFKKLGPIILKLIGALLSLAAVMAIAGLLTAAFSLAFNANSPYVDFPLREIAKGGMYYAGVISGFLVAIIPLIFLVLLGASLLSFKSAFRKIGSLSLLAVWVIAGAIFVNAGIRLAPEIENAYKLQETQITTKQIGAEGFSRLNVGGAFKVNIHGGQPYQVQISGRPEDLEKIYTRVEDGTLVAGRDGYFRFCIFCLRSPVVLDIYAPTIDSASLSGATTAIGENLNVHQLLVHLSGASRFEFSGQINQLNAKLSGASFVKSNSPLEILKLEASGASRFEAGGVTQTLQSAEVKLSGASKAWLNNVTNLNANLSGASKLYYYSAQNIKQNLSGASQIVKQSQNLEFN